jgi:hypothetical protein
VTVEERASTNTRNTTQNHSWHLVEQLSRLQSQALGKLLQTKLKVGGWQPTKRSSTDHLASSTHCGHHASFFAMFTASCLHGNTKQTSTTHSFCQHTSHKQAIISPSLQHRIHCIGTLEPFSSCSILCIQLAMTPNHKFAHFQAML